jgi:chorismate-pyruvate lyase
MLWRLYRMVSIECSNHRLLGNVSVTPPESRNSNEQAEVRLLGNGSLKRILMSTNIQQRFPWIRGILGSPGVSVTTDTGHQ